MMKVYSCNAIRCRCYLLETDDACILIDTSMLCDYAAIRLAISHTKHKKIDAILLTHSHFDHIGNVKRLTKKYHCKAYVSSHGNEKLLDLSMYEVLTQEVLLTYLGSCARLIATPGHSKDSVSIAIANQFTFVGDAMVNEMGMIYPPFYENEKEVRRSFRRLLIDNTKLFYPAHGKPVTYGMLLKTYQQGKNQ